MNVDYLKGQVLLHGKNLKWLAEQMDMNLSTLYVKLNDSDKFKCSELIAMKNALSLTPKDMVAIFPDLLLSDEE